MKAMALALICLAGLVVGSAGCREAAEEPEAEPAVASEAEAAPEAETVTVYVTETGEKYHTEDCAALRESKQAMSLEDAKAKGYTPCSKCNPPE